MKNTSTKGKQFTAEERSAMKERYLELKAHKNDGEKLLLAKIDEMKGSDKKMAQQIHEIVTKYAPELKPKTWYGMPAYANNDGKVVLFFQSAAKFKYRYATLGFNEAAMLDDGTMWATSFALEKITPSEEKRIIELVKKAVK